MENSNKYREGLDIAIVGMAGRFPGADSIEEFYENLKFGKSGISFFEEEELIAYGVSKEDVEKPNYVKAKGVIESAEEFDNKFFGYTPGEAKVMEPQMRLMHECVWEALENAGYQIGSDDSLVGVYVGGSPNPMWETLTFLDDEIEELNPFSRSILNNMDLMATRVSYKLNLKGPSLSMFTSCSTSLVAIHTAVQALLSGECDIAVAGGVSAVYPIKQGYEYFEGMHLSPDGHCRSFDAEANGVVISDAIGLLVLKRVEDAISANDTIDALIIGSAVNNDGNRKVGYTAPSVEGQEEVIKFAQELAEVEPKDIAYVEAHGSGTKLGDNIEIEALRRVFKKEEGAKLTIGTCKTNIGHTNSASGAVGVIKTVLSLKHKEVFPHLNFKTPLPELELDDNPFHIATELERLEGNGDSLIAGVSSFGVGGTNAHVILKEFTCNEESSNETKCGQENERMIVLSAKTSNSLEKQKRNLKEYLEQHREISIQDLEYTLQYGRAKFDYRCAFMASNIEQIIQLLEDNSTRCVWQEQVIDKPQYVWMFSGQGKQYVNMGYTLYKEVPYFHEKLDECFRIAEKVGKYNYEKYLYPNVLSDESELISTAIVQPILFCFEYALASYIEELGVPMDYLIGYSFGEITAACLAGVVSLQDALKMVIARGEVIEQSESGSLLSVPLTSEKVVTLLDEDMSIAIDNGESCVVSGRVEAIEAFQKRLKQERILSIPIQLEFAAHSVLLKEVSAKFEKAMEEISLSAPKKQIISCITGKLLKEEEATSKKYWSEQMLKTIYFHKAVTELPKEKEFIFLEIGPGRDLCNIVLRARTSATYTVDFVSTVHTNSEVTDIQFFNNRLAYLWTLGAELDWNKIQTRRSKTKKIHLPSYAFERNTFQYHKCISEIKNVSSSTKVCKSKDRSEWFYEPYWIQSKLQNGINVMVDTQGAWVLLGKKIEILECIQEKLISKEQRVIWLEPADKYECLNHGHYRINIDNPDDYIKSVSSIISQNLKIVNLIDFMPLEKQEVTEMNPVDTLEHAQRLGMYNLLYFIKAIIKNNMMHDMKCMIVTDSMASITGLEQLNPNYATLVGLSKVINQEFVNVQCATIDIEWNTLKHTEKIKLADSLINEFGTKLGLNEVAYRKQYRWIKDYRKYIVDQKSSTEKSAFKEEGLYIIFGGLGKIGFEIARYLMTKYRARIAIITRKDIISKEEYKANVELSAKEKAKFERLEELQKIGSISVHIADLVNYEEIKRRLDYIEEQYGQINGIIHAAGVTGKETSRAVGQLSLQDCIIQFNAKVFGLCVLEKALENRKIDFCLLCSSLSPILGGLGYGAYAGSSSFMDAFIYYHNQKSEQKWIDVNWETWLNELDSTSAMYALGSYNAQLTLTAEEAMDILERVLRLESFDQIVISTCSLEERLKRWLQLASNEPVTQDIENSPQSYRMRPQLLNTYVAPSTEVEKKLCKIWSNVLGIQGIGIEDNFLELGGDSLKLINSIGLVYKEFNVDIPISEFFNHATISFLVQKIELGKEETKNEIKTVEKKDYYVVSSAQRRLFYLQTLNENSIMYNETKVFTLEGKIDVAKIEDVFQALIKRHEILRTSFTMVNESPVQIIHDNVEFHVDYIKVDGNECDNVIHNCVKPFDLSKPPLIRVILIKVGDDKHRLVLDVNHIISDGVSEDILILEFLALYQGKKLNPLNLQYKDYAEWQMQKKIDNVLKEQEEYWCAQYRGEIPKLDLPLDYNRPKFKSYKGNSIEFILNKEITTQLKDIVKEQSVTLYVLLLSLYSIFLNKMANADDVVIGTNTAGRIQAETQDMLGMFVNTLALRLKPEGRKVFLDYLQEVKTEVLTAFENQDYQFDDLVEKIVKERDFSRNPIFDVSFVWENMDRIDIVVDDVRFVPYQYNNETSRFDLILFGYEFSSELVFRFEYDSMLFKEDTIKRFITYFKYILEHTVEYMNQEIKEINILPEQEIQELLCCENVFDNVAYNLNIVSVFEKISEQYPDKIALSDGESSLTYRELNERVNQLAHTLLSEGVENNSVIVVLLGRNIDMLVTMLGILKAGCGYLPLNPEYPRSRIDFTINDSQAKIIVTSSQYRELIDDVSIKTVLIDSTEYCQDITNPNVKIEPSDLAYVIYTSGTTGKPKGVMIEHKNVVNLILNRDKKLEFSANDVWTLFHSYCFDFSVWEIFGALLTGAKLIVLLKETAQNPKALLNVLEKNEVTILNQTPTAFENLLKVDEFLYSKRLKLRYVIFGGEKLKPYSLKKFKQLHNDVRLINMYGITETTVHVTIKEYDLAEINNSISNIGRAIPGYEVYVLDPYGKIVPIGVKGEIYVGGNGLARGYLNNKELTEEKFIPNPYKHSQRIYRSGDLARRLPSGNLEYCGRKDYQVKIRGHRIELQEIEARLLQCDHIESVRVIVRDDVIQMSSICAYIVSGIKQEHSNLRNELSKFLPDYMIPAYFVQLDELPLTLNGKIDEKALPKPLLFTDTIQNNPENQIEDMLLSIWSEVLGVAKKVISVEKSLFEIGGNSIIVVQIQGKIEQEYNIDVPITVLFQHTTIRAMARYIQSRIHETEEKTEKRLPKTNEDIEVIHEQESVQKTSRLRNRNRLTRED